jgi:hypothetical protein
MYNNSVRFKYSTIQYNLITAVEPITHSTYTHKTKHSLYVTILQCSTKYFIHSHMPYSYVLIYYVQYHLYYIMYKNKLHCYIKR